MRATVLIPTFDNGPPIGWAIQSALDQTVSDLEVFVVGDGTTDETRSIVGEFERSDARVRFFDNPKGPRHGEAHRHRALQEASGEIVCNLCDDDLWLPNHVEEMLALLVEADFAHTMTILLWGDGGTGTWLVDLSDPVDRQMIMGERHPMNLSSIGHRLDAYHRLPTGWHAAPHGINTDHWMSQQWLAEPWVRAVSGRTVTNLHPANSFWEVEGREAKVEATRLWAERIADPQWRNSGLAALTIRAHQNSWAREQVRERRAREGFARVTATRWWWLREKAKRALAPARRT